MPNIVTPSQADTVLEVNRANAIKQAVSRVKAKKPLTKGEVELLQTIAYSAEQGGDPNITEVSTVVDLAAALGVSRRSIGNWRKMPDAPEPKSNGKHDVVAWRKFLHDHHLDGSSPVDEEGLKVRKLLAEVNEQFADFKSFLISRLRAIQVALMHESAPGYDIVCAVGIRFRRTIELAPVGDTPAAAS